MTCTPEPPGTRHVVEPILIVEILSPFTAQRDHRTKLPNYCKIPSVRQILLVPGRESRAGPAPSRTRQPSVTL